MTAAGGAVKDLVYGALARAAVGAVPQEAGKLCSHRFRGIVSTAQRVPVLPVRRRTRTLEANIGPGR